MNTKNDKNDFININDFIEEEEIYQIQVSDTKINIKKIGKGKSAENIIICEKIGKNKDISIYSVVYMKSELIDCEKTAGNYDLLKLYQFNNGDDILSELIVNINDKYELNDLNEISNFDVFFVSQIKSKEDKFIKKINAKNINKTNILEILIFEHTNLY